VCICVCLCVCVWARATVIWVQNDLSKKCGRLCVCVCVCVCVWACVHVFCESVDDVCTCTCTPMCTDMPCRHVQTNICILTYTGRVSMVCMSSFFGGKTLDFAAPRDCYADFKDFQLFTTKP
jgi:hypothetical protein